MGKHLKTKFLLFITSIWISISISISGTMCKSSIAHNNATEKYITAIGDPGMKRDGLRVAIESWNQCNEVGEETPYFGSPTAAHCFDLTGIPWKKAYKVIHRVREEDNKLGFGKPIPGGDPKAIIANVDLYAPQKEIYLAKKCQVQDKPNPWHFWMIMLKNGNLDTYAGICPNNGVKAGPFGPDGQFDCFGKGCMRHPTMNHLHTKLDYQTNVLRGGFFGTWDIINNTFDYFGGNYNSNC